MSTTLWSDIDADFNQGLNKDTLYYKNINSIKQSIKNILNTPKGKDLMNPYFGTAIYDYIFDFLDDLTIGYLQQVISNDILNNEPRITLKEVKVEKTSESSIFITVIFIVKDTKAEDKVNYTITL